jgi:hypothetical protein
MMSEPKVKGLPHVGRGEVLLEEKLHAVCHRLDQPEEGEVLLRPEQGQRHAHAVRADAVLDDRGEAALEVNRDWHQRQHDHEGQADDLHEDDGEREQKIHVTC